MQTDQWSDRHDEANGQFLQFCEFFIPCRQINVWTDMMKLMVNFRNFANTPTNLFSSNMTSLMENLIKVFPVPYFHSTKLDIMPLPHPSYDELTLLLFVA